MLNVVGNTEVGGPRIKSPPFRPKFRRGKHYRPLHHKVSDCKGVTIEALYSNLDHNLTTVT